MKIKPLQDRLVIRVDNADQKSTGGIVLTGENAKQSNKGTVIATGSGRIHDNGVLTPTTVRVGNVVLFNPKAVEHSEKIDGQEFVIVREWNVLGILESKSAE
jgi:chaperonin GroES